MPEVDCAELPFQGKVVRYLRIQSPIEAMDNLTMAEREVVALLCRGKSNKEIAQLRGTSPNTVSNQIVSIFSKVGVHNRHELVARLGGV